MKFLALFLCALAVLVGMYVGVVQLVDPRGEFGTGLFPVVELDLRAEKMRRFEAYHAKAAPDGLILGSSRAMKICPRTLEAATGHRFFNFAVDNARAEDYLAIYRWVRRQGVAVKLLIIGLDVEALHDDDRPEGGLLRNEALMATLEPGTVREPGVFGRFRHYRVARIVQKYKGTLTIQYLTDTARAVKMLLWPWSRPLPMMTFEPDGYLRYRRWEVERAAGTFRFDRDLERCLTKSLTRFDNMRQLSSRRRAYVQQVVDEAVADGARVAVWITSLHPLTTQYLEANTGYGALLAATREYQRALGDRVADYDFSRPERYAGSASGWYDCIHIDETNAERVAWLLAQDLR